MSYNILLMMVLVWFL